VADLPWIPVDPRVAGTLTDACRQAHHAVQLATALGISYLEPRADDSHTNLEWLPEARALASNVAGAVRVAVRVADLTLLVDGAELPLHGRTIAAAVDWLRGRLAKAGLDPKRYTLRRHYAIPAHPVAGGQAFDARADQLTQLSLWFGNAACVLDALRSRTPGASEVRCWPHHFDIATLITVGGGRGRTVGAGLAPGDAYYHEPYFYVNAHPAPMTGALPQTLEGGGTWHTHEWIGAVLPGSRLTTDERTQPAQAVQFLDSAVRTCTKLVSSG